MEIVKFALKITSHSDYAENSGKLIQKFDNNSKLGPDR